MIALRDPGYLGYGRKGAGESSAKYNIWDRGGGKITDLGAVFPRRVHF